MICQLTGNWLDFLSKPSTLLRKYRIITLSCVVFSRFDVTSAPKFGRLERLRNSGRWVTTKRFFSRQLERGKLRYKQVRGNPPSQDSFAFTASASAPSTTTTSSSSNVDQEYDFVIRLISNSIVQRRGNGLKLVNLRQAVITDSHLYYQVNCMITTTGLLINTYQYAQSGIKPPAGISCLPASTKKD